MQQGAHAAELPDVLVPATLPGPTTSLLPQPGPLKHPGWSAAAPHAAAMPESAPLPAPSTAAGIPKRPEWSAQAPVAAEPASEEPGFDYLAEKQWNIITGGTQPYIGTAPVCCPQIYGSAPGLDLSTALQKRYVLVLNYSVSFQKTSLVCARHARLRLW